MAGLRRHALQASRMIPYRVQLAIGRIHLEISMHTMKHTLGPRSVRSQQCDGQRLQQDDLRQFFDRFLQIGGLGDGPSVVTREWTPHVDIREEDARFVLQADLPGVDPAEVEILMDKGILSIKGERKSEFVQNDPHYSRIERRHGVFHRRFALPDTADAERITADGRNGVLEICIPKRAETTPRRIQVGAGSVRTS